MPIVRTAVYICDFCKQPFGPDEAASGATIQVWAQKVDPRNRPNVSDPEAPLTPRRTTRRRSDGRRREEAGEQRWAPDLNVPSPRFPVPPEARWFSLAMHESCCAWFVVNADELESERLASSA